MKRSFRVTEVFLEEAGPELFNAAIEASYSRTSRELLEGTLRVECDHRKMARVRRRVRARQRAARA